MAAAPDGSRVAVRSPEVPTNRGRRRPPTPRWWRSAADCRQQHAERAGAVRGQQFDLDLLDPGVEMRDLLAEQRHRCGLLGGGFDRHRMDVRAPGCFRDRFGVVAPGLTPGISPVAGSLRRDRTHGVAQRAGRPGPMMGAAGSGAGSADHRPGDAGQGEHGLGRVDGDEPGLWRRQAWHTMPGGRLVPASRRRNRSGVRPVTQETSSGLSPQPRLQFPPRSSGLPIRRRTARLTPVHGPRIPRCEPL